VRRFEDENVRPTLEIDIGIRMLLIYCTVSTLGGTDTAACSSELQCRNPVVSEARYPVLFWWPKEWKVMNVIVKSEADDKAKTGNCTIGMEPWSKSRAPHTS
jgi:hypothetical protein